MLEIFTSKRNADYIYEADLSFGSEKEAQNTTTPAPLALDQSLSARQPCLAYVVGDDSVRNSIVNVGQSLFRAGYKPNDTSLPESQRAFLGAISGFKNGPKPCPGFPNHYSSSASFTGTGVGVYKNFGYDDKGSPVQLMVACVYVKPYEPATASASDAARQAAAREARKAIVRASASDNPCKKVPPEGGIVGTESPGLLLDHSNVTAQGSERGRGPVTSGTRGSDRIIGPNSGGTVRTGAGALDVVRAGTGATRVFGGARENVIYGNAGNDLLVGGHGMNYIHAGPGRDRVVVDDGRAVMYGEGGDDLFEAHDMKGTIFGGRGDDKVIATGDLSGLSIASGPGDHVYVLKGAGRPSIVQQPGPGRSTVLTKRDLDVFPNVDVARAIGPWRVTLRGAEQTRRLIAGKGGSVLVSGAAPTGLRGRGGADTIVFNAENSNVAAGGAGADRFVFTGRPETATRPPALERPPGRTASTIADFDPAQGDRLVLRRSVFGGQVLGLRRGFTVVAGAAPWPRLHRATLLLDTDTGVVSFDRDGSGPVSDRVVVRLPGRRSLERSWFLFERS
jgi:Ca2+-binding RTX toxin-like protein